MSVEELESEDQRTLLVPDGDGDGDDLEAGRGKKKIGIGEVAVRSLNRSLSGRRVIGGRGFDDHHPQQQHEVVTEQCISPRTMQTDILSDGAPPEWALLLIGCLLGLATGISVAAFNRGVHLIHEFAWAGTPVEGATWLRLQRLQDTWHRILLIPVSGGVVVGMMHGLLQVIDQIRKNDSSQRSRFDLLHGLFPTIKAIQAAITLGTGCSLGPEGPSVDIGKSCAKGCSKMMENNRERKIALIAAGAAAGIASGFNAAVAGCFFAIETVLRPLQAENSPPFTTAMIILASVISSTVSNVLLGERPAFTVPTYELKSATELPFYLILGMLCGAVSVIFTRLVAWFTKIFQHLENKFHLPAVVCPALGGLGVGLIALRYPGILYWGFTNVDEILHTGKSASAPGIWLLAQLAGAKVVATALCKGSGLVGGLYAPSLMIGAAVGAVFGGCAAEIVKSANLGVFGAVAHPQAYALVGMAATLASVCSVPLTSVLLLFELTKDYRIILPLMGAVGLAIWVPSITNQCKDNITQGEKRSSSSAEQMSGTNWKREGNYLQLSILHNDINNEYINEDAVLNDLKVSEVMSKNYAMVTPMVTVKEAMQVMNDSRQKCVLVVDSEELLDGILTSGDISRRASQISLGTSETLMDDSSASDVMSWHVSSVCTRKTNYRGTERGLFTCFPDMDLSTAKELLEAKGVKQLPVVKRGCLKRERKRRILGLLHYDSIERHLREELDRRKTELQKKEEIENLP